MGRGVDTRALQVGGLVASRRHDDDAALCGVARCGLDLAEDRPLFGLILLWYRYGSADDRQPDAAFAIDQLTSFLHEVLPCQTRPVTMQGWLGR